MKIKTRVFGEIEINEDKTIHFARGIVGFPDMTRFVLLHDEEKGVDVGIRWMQSLDEPAFAMPVLDPLAVMPDYNPVVEDDLLEDIGSIGDDSLLVLVTVSIPSDLTLMSVNLQGPIIINAEKRKACQIIVDNMHTTSGDKYPVKFLIYDILQGRKVGE